MAVQATEIGIPSTENRKKIKGRVEINSKRSKASRVGCRIREKGREETEISEEETLTEKEHGANFKRDTVVVPPVSQRPTPQRVG